jgi:hypothetical protein
MNRPLTRLVHWWSHAIPTIYYGTQTYLEVSHAHNTAVDFACYSLRCVVDKITQLQRAADRCRLAKEVLEVSSHYETYESVFAYARALCATTALRSKNCKLLSGIQMRQATRIT